jgi:hypothetical protein
MTPGIMAGGYLKDRKAKITVHEAEQLFEELWSRHVQALLMAFERRFELAEARLRAEFTGIPIDEDAVVQASKPLPAPPSGDIS